MPSKTKSWALAAALILSASLNADENNNDLSGHYAGLTIRDIGPALTSGRITDFAMHPGGWVFGFL